jgi:hypothetical protein
MRTPVVFALGLSLLGCGSGSLGEGGAPASTTGVGGGATGAGGDATTSSSSATTSSTTTASGAGGASTSTSAGGSGGGATTSAGGAGGAPADPCLAIAPSPDAATNRAAILDCLKNAGHATLLPGEFPIDTGLAVPPGATLLGDPANRPVLRLVATNTNYVLRSADSTTIGWLRVDANAALPKDANEAIVHVGGSKSLLHDLELWNGQPLPVGTHSVGLYVIDSQAADNTLQDLDVHDSFYGVIFVQGLDASHVNTLKGGHVHDTKCDGVTLVGYGALVGVEIDHCGRDCENGPIPGASVYSLENHAGARIEGCHLHHDCGAVVDLDRIEGFEIKDNHVHDPGETWNGQYPWCGGAAAMGIIDASHLTITGNVVENSNRPQNRIQHDPNGVFSSHGSGTIDDLPQGTQQTIAFWLGRRKGGPPVVGNEVRGNQLRSYCGAGCVGLGYFVSRSTGTDANGAWSAATTSYFTHNDPFGSNVGSKRCGQNWYAASSTCKDGALDADCNTDDPQHDGDWARNDACPTYL